MKGYKNDCKIFLIAKCTKNRKMKTEHTINILNVMYSAEQD